MIDIKQVEKDLLKILGTNELDGDDLKDAIQEQRDEHLYLTLEYKNKTLTAKQQTKPEGMLINLESNKAFNIGSLLLEIEDLNRIHPDSYECLMVFVNIYHVMFFFKEDKKKETRNKPSSNGTYVHDTYFKRTNDKSKRW